jgi:hypothetical protein
MEVALDLAQADGCFSAGTSDRWISIFKEAWLSGRLCVIHLGQSMRAFWFFTIEYFPYVWVMTINTAM